MTLTNNVHLQTLEQLRQNINAATQRLVSSSFLAEDATLALYKILQAQVASLHESLSSAPGDATQEEENHSSTLKLQHDANRQQSFCAWSGGESEQQNDDDDDFMAIWGEDIEEDFIDIHPLYVRGTSCQASNHLVVAQPFVIHPLEGDLDKNEMQDCLACMAAVALYNLGLARHHQAYEMTIDNTERVALLQEAALFYHQSHKLLDELPKSLPAEGMLIMLYLATCNNLAEVHNALANKPVALAQAKHWQETLHTTLLLVPPAPQLALYRHFCSVAQFYSVHSA